MSSARHLRWLPNALTISRYFLAIVIFVAILHEAWALAFWVFIGALLTDFFDGLAAQKLHAKTTLGAKLDGSADASLVVAGLIGLGFTGRLSWWFVGTILTLVVILASDRLSVGGRGTARRRIIAVGFLLVNWTGLVWVWLVLLLAGRGSMRR